MDNACCYLPQFFVAQDSGSIALASATAPIIYLSSASAMADLFGEDEEDDILDMEGGPAIQREDALLMRFCPHDSSMLYPQVRVVVLSSALLK